jgi:hypothetical protein
LVPRYVAQIVDRRQMCGGRKVGIAQTLAGEPVAGAHQPADVVEMIANIGECRADRIGFGRPTTLGGTHVALEDPFQHQRAAHFGKKLVVEPVQQAPNLHPAADVDRQQPMAVEGIASGLVEVFRNDRSARNRGPPLFQKNWRRAGRVEGQEFVSPLPGSLLDEHRIEAVLADRDADEPGMRAEGVMVQCEHGFWWGLGRTGGTNTIDPQTYRNLQYVQIQAMPPPFATAPSVGPDQNVKHQGVIRFHHICNHFGARIKPGPLGPAARRASRGRKWDVRARHSQAFACRAGRVGPKALNAGSQPFCGRLPAGDFLAVCHGDLYPCCSIS